MLCSASRNRGSSSGRCSSGASQKSVSKPKRRLLSRFARKRTSSASTRCSMPLTLVSIVGMMTRAHESAGIPCEKSIRGNGCGATNRVASQFVNATASWLADSSKSTPINAKNQSGTLNAGNCACTSANKLPVRSSVINAITPK